jgi:hypothetical protein
MVDSHRATRLDEPTRSPEGVEMSQQRAVGSGWASFSGVLFMIAGFWNLFAGIAALARKEYFSAAGLLYHNLQLWGWVWLVVGAIQLITSWLIISQRESGRVLGIILASISMLVWFLSIGAYPLWGVLVVTIDALILYGLIAHGEQFS